MRCLELVHMTPFLRQHHCQHCQIEAIFFHVNDIRHLFQDNPDLACIMLPGAMNEL